MWVFMSFVELTETESFFVGSVAQLIDMNIWENHALKLPDQVTEPKTFIFSPILQYSYTCIMRDLTHTQLKSKTGIEGEWEVLEQGKASKHHKLVRVELRHAI